DQVGAEASAGDVTGPHRFEANVNDPAESRLLGWRWRWLRRRRRGDDRRTRRRLVSRADEADRRLVDVANFDERDRRVEIVIVFLDRLRLADGQNLGDGDRRVLWIKARPLGLAE